MLEPSNIGLLQGGVHPPSSSAGSPVSPPPIMCRGGSAHSPAHCWCSGCTPLCNYGGSSPASPSARAEHSAWPPLSSSYSCGSSRVFPTRRALIPPAISQPLTRHSAPRPPHFRLAHTYQEVKRPPRTPCPERAAMLGGSAHTRNYITPILFIFTFYRRSAYFFLS